MSLVVVVVVVGLVGWFGYPILRVSFYRWRLGRELRRYGHGKRS